MPSTITNLADRQPAATSTAELFENGFDPIETAVRDRVHGFIQAMIEAELDEALSRTRYARHAKACPASRSETPDGETAAGDAVLRGHRHGHRSRSLMGTFGETLINVPRARIEAPNGKTTEWRSNVLPTYQRRTKAADALIAGAYLSGTNTRRVRRALAAPRLREGRHCSAALTQGYGQPGLAEGEDRLGMRARLPTSRSSG